MTFKMENCFLFSYRNKLEVSIHYSWLNSIVMNIIRLISLILIIIRFFAYYGSNSELSQYSFIYLTFYGFVVTWIYYGCVMLEFLICRLILKSESKIVKILEDCINLLFEIAFSLEFTLTLLYWTVLYSSTDLDSWGFNNLGVHLMPILLLLIDFIFNSYQFPIRHMFVTFIMGGIYLIINQVRTCNGEPVYEAYECGNVWLPIVAFIILAISHALGHLVWKFVRVKQIEKNLHSSNYLIGGNQILWYRI